MNAHQNRQFRRQAETLGQRFASQEQQLREELRQTQQQVEQLRSQLGQSLLSEDSLRAELIAAQAQAAHWQNETEDWKVIEDGTKWEKEVAEEELAAVQTQLTQAQAENATLRQNIADLDAYIKTWAGEKAAYDKMQRRLHNKSQELDTVTAELNRLRRQLAGQVL